jgi:hypothetical protein
LTPFVPFPDGVQGELLFDYFGLPISNRLWFIDRFPPTLASDVDDAAVGLATWYALQVLPLLGNDLIFLGSRVSRWDTSPSSYVSSFPVSIPGGSSVRSHGASVAYRVLFQGDNSQDFKLNANIIPGIPLDMIVGNTMDAGFRSALRDAYINLIDDTGRWTAGNKWRWQVGSSRLGGVYRSTLASARTDLIHVTDLYSTQRRRRTGF